MNKYTTYVIVVEIIEILGRGGRKRKIKDAVNSNLLYKFILYAVIQNI